MTKFYDEVNKMRFLILPLLVLSAIFYGQTPNIQMNIRPNSIQIGKSAELSWDVKDAERVYITHVGKVLVKGKKRITPEDTTTFTLIAEGPSGFTSESVTVLVEGGGRDGLDFPDKAKFKYPLSYKLSVPSFIDLVDHIHNVLQDDMGFSLNEYEDHQNGCFVFITNKSQKGEWIQSGERRIGARRVAYLVEVKKPVPASKNLTYTVKILIDYKLRIERTWRPERNESIYQQAGHRLKEEINRIL